jgi:hypothetical protein
MSKKSEDKNSRNFKTNCWIEIEKMVRKRIKEGGMWGREDGGGYRKKG